MLIPGGAGFIGSHIAEWALGQGHEVAVVDNLSRGRRANVPEGCALFEVDICNALELGKVFDAFAPQWVSHQAAQASVARSVTEPLWDLEVNALGTLRVLELARRYKVERLVYASTGGALYGEVPEGSQAKESDALSPQSPYAISKGAGEHYVLAYRRLHGVETTVLRYSNVYGPRQDPHGEAGVVAMFCEAACRGKPIAIFGRREAGDGGCVRDYVAVTDVVAAHEQALLGTLPAVVINVGTAIATRTLELAHTVQEIAVQQGLPGFGGISQEGPRAGDLQRSVLDTKLLKQALERPVCGLRDGLATTLRWFASQ